MSEGASTVAGMIIDCGSCTVRGDACTDCVVTFLTVPVREGAGPPPPPGDVEAPAPGATREGAHARVSATDLGTGREVDLDHAEQEAIAVLARSGLVPPLRLVRAG